MRSLLTFLLWACTLVGISALGSSEEIEVPFDFLHNQIVFGVMVNGQGPYNFVLDSGTHASAIDLALAKRLGLKLGPAASQGIGAGTERIRGRQTVCRELRFGGLVVKDLVAVALDLSALSGQLGRPLHGVLGFSFLDSRITQIDYFHWRLRFYSESPFSPSIQPPDGPKRVTFPMQFRGNSILPIFEDCIVNGAKITVTLDTGSSLGLILFPHAIQQLGLNDLAQKGIPLQAAGYRGEARITKGWVRSVVPRSIDLGAIEVGYALRGYGEGESRQTRDGNLGNAVLQDFIVTLDYIHRVVVLELVDT